jgi:hypothetical protein
MHDTFNEGKDDILIYTMEEASGISSLSKISRLDIAYV